MSNISYDLWQKVGSWKTVSYCSRCDMQKSCHFQRSFSSNFYEEKAVLNILCELIFNISRKNIKSFKTKLSFKINFLGYSKWKESALDVTLQRGKENHKFTFISEEINAWNTFWNINKLTRLCSETIFSKNSY